MESFDECCSWQSQLFCAGLPMFNLDFLYVVFAADLYRRAPTTSSALRLVRSPGTLFRGTWDMTADEAVVSCAGPGVTELRHLVWNCDTMCDSLAFIFSPKSSLIALYVLYMFVSQ